MLNTSFVQWATFKMQNWKVSSQFGNDGSLCEQTLPIYFYLSFAVGSDGAAYEGRGWKTLGAHALHFNTVSIGICVIGNWTCK